MQGFLNRISLACDAQSAREVLEQALIGEKLHLYRIFSLSPAGTLGPPPVYLGDLARQLDEASGGPSPSLMETILFLRDENSRALAQVEWGITLPDGTASEARARADGGATIPHASQVGDCKVSIRAIGPLVRERFEVREDLQPTMLCNGLELTIPAGSTTTKRLRRPHALVFGLNRYYPGQRTFLPRTIVADASRTLDTIDVAADFLAAMSSRQDWSAVVLGHADPSGSSGKNDEITSARAESVHAFLSGDCDGWLHGLSEDDPEVAARVFLAWVSERFGWDVHTGEELEWNARCEEALGRYRQHAATHLDVSVGDGKRMVENDWRAAFALMEEALRASLLDSPDGLETLRGQLSVPTNRRIGCSDRFSEQTGTETDPDEDRRVELVLLEDESFLPGDDVVPEYIYGRWIRRVRVPAPSRLALSLSLRAMPGYPVAAVPFVLEAERHKGEGESSTHGSIAKSRAPLGAFHVKAHAAKPMNARDLAVRIRAALDAGNAVGLIPALTRPGQAAEELADAYERRFGAKLADDVLGLTRGTPVEAAVAALLTRGGLHSDERVVLHGLHQ